MARQNSRLQKALLRCRKLEESYRQGLQAIASQYHQRISVSDTQALCGSANIEPAMQALRPNQPAWDYVLCYKGEAHFVEMHPARCNQNMREVRNKFQVLRSLLDREWQALEKIRARPAGFYWVYGPPFELPHNARLRLQAIPVRCLRQLNLH